MTSFKARLITSLIRNRHLFQGRLSKERFDANTSIQAFRDQCEKGAARFGKLPETVHVSAESLEHVRAEWLVPKDAPKEKLIFYVHGGGYVSGSCDDHRSIVAKIAEAAGITCLQFEYRLAPEFPFPHAVQDSLLVYRTVLQKGYSPENLVMMGESAGGGLTLSLLLAIREENLPMPNAAVAISPWTDLSCSAESYRTKNSLSVAPLDSWTVFSNHYAGKADKKTPLISPLFGDLHGLPPLLINAGESDELYDDGFLFAQKAKASGVEVTFSGGVGMVHCYPLLAPMFKEATEAFDEIINFVKQKLKA